MVPYFETLRVKTAGLSNLRDSKLQATPSKIENMKTILTLLITIVTALGLGTARADDKPSTSGVPASYPLKKCVVSDEELGGEMGKPIKVVHDGVDVYLCCKSCVKDFSKDPAKFVAKVKAAQPKK